MRQKFQTIWDNLEVAVGALPGITLEQAYAFLETLSGWQTLGDQCGVPKSSHAYTHLEAVLGYRKIPEVNDIMRIVETRKRGKNIWSDPYLGEEREKAYPFVRYLLGVAMVLALSTCYDYSEQQV